MSTVFQWKDAYTVKIAAMDHQHKTLFGIVNELHSAMGVGEAKSITKEILDRVVDYTVHHFASEEALMQRYNYPGLPGHREEHAALTARVLEFRKEFEAGAADITPKLLTFLQQWLRHHIQTVDRRYGEFLSAQGIH